MSNHLAHETSPYLLQHAGNPVDWHPWGTEALEKARQEDKPIFLSIGYAACHWCHVMAHESFEDQSTGDVLNRYFVCIKVDREERPDLDSIYMNFVVSVTGSGGWPLSVFLTPDGQPFYGGTYFPSFRRHNLPAFSEVLQAIIHTWTTDRNSILSSSDSIVKSLKSPSKAPVNKGSLSLDALMHMLQTVSYGYDWQNGGWGAAPKFPQPVLIEFLLRQASRRDEPSLKMALHALRAMAQGGMYDLLGGGFARYSMDSTWLVPHFEKMLYDNALLAIVYLHAYQLTEDRFFRDVCQATLDFVLRELAHPMGGFYCSLDADSEGLEGKYYLWTPQEIRSTLVNRRDADLFIGAYGVTELGNFGGFSILHRSLTDELLSQQFHLKMSTIATRLDGLRRKLLQVRDGRVRPATDDKVLVYWNSLMLAALAEAGRALDRPDYLQAAMRNAHFLLEHMQQDGRLLRSWREGKASHAAYLEDYAGLGLGLLTLYQSDPNPRWYQSAIHMLEQVLAHFTDPSGGFFDTADDHESLLYRPKEIQDSPTPSGNALALMLLLKLAAYEGRAAWRQLAEEMLSANADMLLRYPSAFAYWLCAADFALGPARQVAIIGDLSDPSTQSLLEPLWGGYHPRIIIAASPYPPPSGSPALMQDRPLLDSRPTAYVCQDFVCQLPTNDPQVMQAQL